jgi:hypothetical protein
MIDNLKAQTLVKENRLWSNSMFGTERENFWQNSNWIKFEGDTTINETVFKKIFRSDDEFHENWYCDGAIREDSIKKVFIHKENKESLLYDFNLNIGDSIINYYGHYLYVIKVDTVEIGYFNKPLRRIFLSYRKNEEPYWWNSWIEGIGSFEGILLGSANIGRVGAVYRLVCYYENDTLKYQNDHHSFCFPKGYYEGIYTHASNENCIKVIVSNEFISFRIEESKSLHAQLYLYEITGRSIGLFEFESIEKLDIPRNRFYQGLYVYYFRDKEYSEVGKFVVY